MTSSGALRTFVECVLRRFSHRCMEIQFNSESEWLSRHTLIGRNMTCWFVVITQWKNGRTLSSKILLSQAGIKPKPCSLISQRTTNYITATPLNLTDNKLTITCEIFNPVFIINKVILVYKESLRKAMNK